MTKKAKFHPHSTEGNPSGRFQQGTQSVDMRGAIAQADAQLAQAQAANVRDRQAQQAVANAATQAAATAPIADLAGKAHTVEDVTK